MTIRNRLRHALPAADAMQWCVAKGLLQGTDAGALLPNGTATRAQIATIMMRYLAS